MTFKQVVSLATVLLFSLFIVIACGGGSKKKPAKTGDSTSATTAAGADLNKKVLVIGEGGSLSIFDPQDPMSYRGGGSSSACCGRKVAPPAQENQEPNFIVVPTYDKIGSSNQSPNCCGRRR